MILVKKINNRAQVNKKQYFQFNQGAFLKLLLEKQVLSGKNIMLKNVIFEYFRHLICFTFHSLDIVNLKTTNIETLTNSYFFTNKIIKTKTKPSSNQQTNNRKKALKPPQTHIQH